MNTMKIRLLRLFLFISFFNFISLASIGATKIIVTDKDKVLLQEKFDKFLKDKDLSTGELVYKIGTDFMGTPYVASTLDKTKEENLVVNLRELDCTTFVENCIAIARTIKSGEATYDRFVKELETLRYRNGKLNGYTSRLHYIAEWMIDNATKGIVMDVTGPVGGEQHKVNLNFMSTHPDSYPQLLGQPKLVEEINQIESRVSAKPFYYIPKEKIASCEKQIIDGDVVAFVTKILGMDVSHVGILFTKEGRVFLLHAPLSGGKVLTTKVPLAEYLKDSKSTTGIFVIRAL
jgi:hypothetical protein